MKLAVFYNPNFPELRHGLFPDVFQSGDLFSSRGVTMDIIDSEGTLRRNAPDVVHVIGADASTCGWIKAQGDSHPHIVISPLLSTSRSSMFSWIMGFMPSTCEAGLRGSATLLDACIAQHEKEQALVSSLLSPGESPVAIIPLVDVTEMCAANPVPFVSAFRQRDFILASVDAAASASNVFRLFQALENINNPSIVMLRGGEGTLDEPCRTIARSSSHLILLDANQLGTPLCISALAACAVFVDASEVVLRGVGVLAAAAAGANIVVSRHGAMNGFFGGEANYVEPTSWELIHHGIITALNKKRDGRLREHIGRICSRERTVERLLGIYDRLLSGQR